MGTLVSGKIISEARECDLLNGTIVLYSAFKLIRVKILIS